MATITKEKREKQKQERVGEKRINNKGFEMECIEYFSSTDITIKFIDPEYIIEHKSWQYFDKGKIEHPLYKKKTYGMIGTKYPSRINGTHTKEYNTWKNMMTRCFSDSYKNKNPTYMDATCCDEWLLYENFYDWLHSQENFDKWLNGKYWAVDKDILVKGNKLYSPETCCLVPKNVNMLFVKHDSLRGECVIGVNYDKRDNTYIAHCENNGKLYHIGVYNTEHDAFVSYKNYKESLIRKIAKEEYEKCNINKKCYEAMMSYEVEITD